MRLLVTGGSGFIGTNLMAQLRHADVPRLNLDIAPPLCPAHQPDWQRCDILDREALQAAFRSFAPTHVVHLAARTDCDEKATLDDYRANTTGTQHVLEAIAATSSVARVVITSTQFVCSPGVLPRYDEDFSPFTVYGSSKVITEQLTRQANLPCTWTIVRPTTIWGPWLLRHCRQVFRVMRRGLYLHPGWQPCIRSWGYVGNVVYQFLSLLELPREPVHGRVFYLGDPPINLRDWVNAVSRRLVGREVRTVPRGIVWLLALAGEVAQRIGLPSPLTLSRYRSMTRDYAMPMDATLRVLGPAPYSMEAGIEEVLRWLADYAAELLSAAPPQPATTGPGWHWEPAPAADVPAPAIPPRPVDVAKPRPAGEHVWAETCSVKTTAPCV
jgi:nucleoside-diphosphate-sugar epimerase